MYINFFLAVAKDVLPLHKKLRGQVISRFAGLVLLDPIEAIRVFKQ